MATPRSGVCFHFRFIGLAFAEPRSRGLGLAGREEEEKIQKGERKGSMTMGGSEVRGVTKEMERWEGKGGVRRDPKV